MLSGSMVNAGQASEGPPIRIRLGGGFAITLSVMAVVFLPRYYAVGTALHLFGFILGSAIGLPCFLLWWLFRSRAPWLDRILGLLVLLACGAVTAVLADPSMGLPLIVFAIPVVMFVTMLGLALLRSLPWGQARYVMPLVIAAACLYWALLRFEGVDGTVSGVFSWRWEPTAEAQYLAELEAAAVVGADDAQPVEPRTLTPQVDDWLQFRGRRRDGQVRGTNLSRDWLGQTPQRMWRRSIGPGWSSFCVVDGHLFTQEQRGEMEAVVCLDGETGNTLWVYEYPSRFVEMMAGPGPRATPSFADGRVYALGATGRLACLDGATGVEQWSRNIAQDGQAAIPEWGFSSSPLVVDGLVVVFAGGGAGKALLAYTADDGQLTWTAGDSRLSYSSPQFVSLLGEPQVVMHDSFGLTGYRPADGEQLWQYAWPMPKHSRVTQPALVGERQMVTAMGYGTGARLVEFARVEGTWTTTELWESRQLKPYYNDFVVHQGFAYGFDSDLFTCLDLTTGKRAWKRGRYGNGQVLLLPDQELLIVLSEKGQIVLLEANPRRHVELAKVDGIEGKTWNHPVLVGDRLYIRNGEQAACYVLPLANAVSSAP